MEEYETPSVEEVVRDSLDDSVGISYVMERTGLSESEADNRLRSLHREGVITYFPELQPSGAKVAKWNHPHEEPERDQED
ncbi:MAG: hypothetical protein GTN40_04970 [Candidatus Aenigmarchaeota archaeon]|nr:hypothetical protein [Candidatus Aenigmarchaeota archaeon]NIO45058.1 hypothetical protein [Candidatus Aenigmarchaeota archaeon]